MSKLEVIYRNEITTLLLRTGYNVYLPVFDEGIDMIAHREADGKTMLVQQKSRFTINKKYLERNIWVAFRDRNAWYLAPHDDLVVMPETEQFRTTTSWIERGGYNVKQMSRKLAAACEKWRLRDVEERIS